MSTVKVPVVPGCMRCEAPFDLLIVGGVGDWRNKVMCTACGGFWPVSPGEVLRLAALQYGVHELAIQEADAASQAEYESVCLGGPQAPDLPASLGVARWHARRLARRQP